MLTFRSNVSLNISKMKPATIAVALTVILTVTPAAAPAVTRIVTLKNLTAMILAVTLAVTKVTETSKQAMKSGVSLKITALETTPGTSRIDFYLISRTCVSRIN